jgi:hypothetical protein
MPNPTRVFPFRGYDLAETYRDGRLRHCDVWQGDKHVASFHGPDARDKARRWVLAEIARQKYPRISMRRVSNGR